MAKKKYRPPKMTTGERLVAAYCDKYPKAVDALAEMMPKERLEYVMDIAIAIFHHVPAEVLRQYDTRIHLGIEG